MSFLENTHSIQFKDTAKELNIDLYGRYGEKEAMGILGISQLDLDTIIINRLISSLQLTKNKTEFFGYQLIEYLFDSVVNSTVESVVQDNKSKIIRFPEVREKTGLSRTTLWRFEKEGKFPRRVSLGANSVGWRLNEVANWIRERK